jgi:hypothetical protein
MGQIIPDNRAAFRAFIKKYRMLGTSAQSLDTEATRACKNIKHFASAKGACNDIEKRSFHLIRSRSCRSAFNRFKLQSSRFS